MQGDWVLSARDVAGQDIGKLNRWSIEIALATADQTIRSGASPALKIPDNDPNGTSSAITISQTGIIRHAKVKIDISHSHIGDLRIELVSPSAKRVILHSQLGGGQDNLVMTYESSPGSALTPLVGESAQGDWVLRVVDLEAEDIGMLNGWSLEFVTSS